MKILFSKSRKSVKDIDFDKADTPKNYLQSAWEYFKLSIFSNGIFSPSNCVLHEKCNTPIQDGREMRNKRIIIIPLLLGS